MTDAELFRLYESTGDESYFAELYEQLIGPVTSYVLQSGFNQDMAGEKAHEAITSLIDKPGAYDRNRPLRPYLCACAFHAAVSEARKLCQTMSLATLAAGADRLTYDPQDAREQNAADSAALREVRQRVRAAVATLPPKYRDVVQAHKFEGLNMMQAARALDIPVGTVKRRWSRAKKMLRVLLGPGFVKLLAA